MKSGTRLWRSGARRSALGVVALALAWPAAVPSVTSGREQAPSFASEIASLSESPGYFDTDNLISNERSYLHVIPELEALPRGGAYVGVGPDQNFSYIAHVRPAVAYLIDIRRDNLLLHLLFKAVFKLARTRVEYLAILFGRPPPEPLTGWETKSIDGIISYVDGAKPLPAPAMDALHARIATTLQSFGVPLSAADKTTIDRFHQQFIANGLGLQFHSAGRAPQWDYPTYRDLALEKDRAGQRRSFLVSEDDFQFLKSLQARDLMIPVVGDLSGPTALAAIGRTLTARKQALSAFYVSNVEFYLFREGGFPRFIANLSRLPLVDGAVVIRSFFQGQGSPLPGYNSASSTQSIKALLDGYSRGQFRQYWELANARKDEPVK